MINAKVKIFDIQRNSFVDGPGIRTTVFFKGCNLKCAWCHNPEGQSAEREWMYYPNKCVGCGRCETVNLENTDFICLHDAKTICGKEFTVDEVMKEILKDRIFYETSNGGVTFSGGECMLQIDLLEEILKECKAYGIHTAIDTAGHVPFEYFERILPHTDLFLYDVKCFDRIKHKQYTGVDNERILDNLKRLLMRRASVWIRIPVIVGVNDSDFEMKEIKKYLDSFGAVEKIELLPYHAMGEHKYAALGRELQQFSTPSEKRTSELKRIFL